MRYETIADIYSANKLIRERLLAVLRDIDGEQAASRSGEGSWSVSEIVEHLAIVEGGTLRICTKLIDAAKEAGKPGDDRVDLPASFNEKALAVAGTRVEAPERVRPTGEQSVEDSVEKLEEYRSQFDHLRSDLESYDISDHTFPHPFFGDLNAAEWMIVLGGHEARHTAQIERAIGQSEAEAQAS